MPFRIESPVQRIAIERLKGRVLEALCAGELRRVSLMLATSCREPHRMQYALAELVETGRIVFRVEGNARLYRLPATAVERKQVAPLPARRGVTYGECPCGCTPRVAGYFTHPTEPWKSGPVLCCGRSAEAA